MTYQIWMPGSARLQPSGDDRAEARRQIEAAALSGDDQDRLRREVLAFTAEHPDCLHRRCPPGHLTASAMVVDPGTGQVLLIHHAKIGRWLQPGGHADGEGNLALVAVTEASEETGLTGLSVVTPAIDVDIHAIGERPGEPAHHHLDLRFVVLIGSDRELAPNHETLGARWLSLDHPILGDSTELGRLARRGVEVARTVVSP